MTNIKHRTIWLVREPRSGSSQIALFLAKHINRQYYFLESDVENKFLLNSFIANKNINPLEIPKSNLDFFYPKIDDPKYFYNTHCFNILQIMHRYEKPILIRCVRENIVEQFLSVAALQKYGFRNLNYNEDPDKNTAFQEFISQKIVLKKEAFKAFIIHKLKNAQYWKKYVEKNNYEHYTITYEQMLKEEIKIPVLELNQRIAGYTDKLPDNYKKNIFKNIEDVFKWNDELKNITKSL